MYQRMMALRIIENITDASPLTIVKIPIARLIPAKITTIVLPHGFPENNAPAIPKLIAAITPAKTSNKKPAPAIEASEKTPTVSKVAPPIAPTIAIAPPIA